VRIAIAEDYRMMRDLLRTVCTGEFGYEVVAEADTGPRAVEEVRRTKPDLLLLDLHLPGFDGFTVIERVRAEANAPRILVISSYCDDYTVSRIDAAAITGFIDKNGSTVAVLREALAAVAGNGTYFSATVRNLVERHRTNADAFDARLSARERTVLLMIGRLLTDQEIAVHLNISGATVEKHRFNIYRKLGLKSRAELMRYARDHGFFELPD
jgi:two-component system, NarL family, response regulator NreC